MFNVRVERVLEKGIEDVFAALSDHESYDRFPGVTKAVLLEEGSEERNGKGALREISLGGTVLEERIVDFERPTRMGYRIVKASPLPLQHDLGEITLAAEGDRTRVIWVSEGHVKIPVLGSLLLDGLVEKRLGAGFASMLKLIEQR